MINSMPYSESGILKHDRNNRSSSYKGVSKSKKSPNWQIVVCLNKKSMYVGCVNDIKKAAIISDLI